MFRQLTRYRLSAMVAFSALAGYVLCPGRGDLPTAVFLAMGVFLLAAGCSALNQVQERDLDARMERTRGRPLPSGRLRPGAALALSLTLLLAGTAILAQGRPLLVPALGLSAVLCYNGVYTPLKRRTSFALLPGALCGAIPPLIGWTAAGGDPEDCRIVALAGLFFLWQVPHFWLLAWKWREDYRRAGLPTVHNLLTPELARKIFGLWIIALAAATSLIPTLGLIDGSFLRLFWMGVTAVLLGLGLAQALGRRDIPLPTPALGVVLFLLTAALVVDALRFS